MKFECPNCGETKKLRGQRDKDLVHITCQTCGNQWTHDPWKCATCGGPLHERRKPLLQKARGTQQSIIGYNVVKECPRCDPPADQSTPGWMSATMDT
jgi:ribosomal protein L37E